MIPRAPSPYEGTAPAGPPAPAAGAHRALARVQARAGRRRRRSSRPRARAGAAASGAGPCARGVCSRCGAAACVPIRKESVMLPAPSCAGTPPRAVPQEGAGAECARACWMDGLPKLVSAGVCNVQRGAVMRWGLGPGPGRGAPPGARGRPRLARAASVPCVQGVARRRRARPNGNEER
ncbi:MAG: hypothetical protein J3K34DRAFT_223188 [Monoraphidium minutum]|nr:MAG: hypothetical protein J3K34DRAFT_223188 [Monoraphidium minutum]